MDYLIAKSIHIIFVVSYFAGIFYMVRLFVYHTETLLQDAPNKREILHTQYAFMQERLWNIITIPSLVIMIISGVYLLHSTHWVWLKEGWMHIKLSFVVFLLIYHFWCWKAMKQLQKQKPVLSSVALRMMNEVATLILFVVVFAIVLKNVFIENWHWALGSFFVVGVLIMLVVRLVNSLKKIDSLKNK